MSTPIFQDHEGNEMPMEMLGKLAKIPSFRARGMLRSLPEEIIREGEDVRLVLVKGIFFRRAAMEEQILGGGPFEYALAPEPENPEDPHAVAVHLNGAKIGYVAKEVAPQIQSMAMEGQCRVAAATRPVREGDNYILALLVAWSCAANVAGR